MYKKEYQQVFETKDEDFKKKYNYENFKDFRNYVTEIKDKKTDGEADEETDEETVITWMHRPKNEFDKLLNKVTRYRSDVSRTKAGNKTITPGNAKNF